MNDAWILALGVLLGALSAFPMAIAIACQKPSHTDNRQVHVYGQVEDTRIERVQQ